MDRLEHMTDSQLVDHCSSHADGSELVHVLCDRLTERAMRLAAANHKLTELQELLHVPT